MRILPQLLDLGVAHSRLRIVLPFLFVHLDVKEVVGVVYKAALDI